MTAEAPAEASTVDLAPAVARAAEACVAGDALPNAIN